MAVKRWVLLCAWLGLVVLGGALESALLDVCTSIIGSYSSIQVGVWALALWSLLVAPGAALAVVLLVKPAPVGGSAGSRRKTVIVTGVALSVLVACVSSLMWVLIGNLDSAHLIESGRPVDAWLGPGVYQINQDPSNGGFNTGPGELSFFSVANGSGSAEVIADLSSLSPHDIGGLFVGAGRNGYFFLPEGHFRITRPGEYRLVNHDDALYPAILVTDPYGAVGIRTIPWIAGGQAAFWALLGCMAFTRGRLKLAVAESRPRGPDYAFT